MYNCVTCVVLSDPLRIVVGAKNAAVASVEQRLVYCGASVMSLVRNAHYSLGSEKGKLLALRQQIREGVTPPVLIFVQSKERANELYRELLYDRKLLAGFLRLSRRSHGGCAHERPHGSAEGPDHGAFQGG